MELLDHFFGAYFHRDWASDASSWQDVVRRFRADEGSAVSKRLAKEIGLLLAEHPTDVELASAMSRLGCYYWPGSSDQCRMWLGEVVDMLRARVN
ncbi:contact-dependent growth inhibition system immunity protein [Dyella sp. Tek66A03]|uniref:contact-dependent growth inhibition system immunity protein n=1 Tax=Dyella sp. Tek66A03 TaxID=3458298 RepID=UPI00403EED56